VKPNFFVLFKDARPWGFLVGATIASLYLTETMPVGYWDAQLLHFLGGLSLAMLFQGWKPYRVILTCACTWEVYEYLGEYNILSVKDTMIATFGVTPGFTGVADGFFDVALALLGGCLFLNRFSLYEKAGH
jgi:hypothetical protein